VSGSSQNALKRGFHAVGLLPGEDEQGVLALHKEICGHYRVTTGLDMNDVDELVRAMVMLRRIDRYRQDILEAVLYGRDCKEEFRSAAGLTEEELPSVPDGLLVHDPAVVVRGWEVKLALTELARIMRAVAGTSAAAALEGSPANASHVRLGHLAHRAGPVDFDEAGVLHGLSTHSPQLYKELRTLGLEEGEDVAGCLEVLYGAVPLGTQLVMLWNELSRENKVAMLWHQNEAKYLKIIASLRAKASLGLVMDPGALRYETTAFNRVQRLRDRLQARRDEASRGGGDAVLDAQAKLLG
jgi:hypothetical protein